MKAENEPLRGASRLVPVWKIPKGDVERPAFSGKCLATDHVRLLEYRVNPRGMRHVRANFRNGFAALQSGVLPASCSNGYCRRSGRTR